MSEIINKKNLSELTSEELVSVILKAAESFNTLKKIINNNNKYLSLYRSSEIL